MPLATKAVYLEVRPFQVSHLCFEVGGILGEAFTELGAPVSAFDFGALYKAFRAATPSNAVDPGRLEFDSNAIDVRTKLPTVIKIKNLPPSEVPRKALAALRAETLRAALDKAINARANAVMTKYSDPVGTVTSMIEFANIKSNALVLLNENSERQANLLFDEYKKDQLTGVVKTTQSVITSNVTTVGDSTTKDPNKEITETAHSETVDKEGGKITTTTTEIGYRVPFLETDARNLRARISVRDEILSHSMQRQGLERFEEVFKNELASIDTDINQLQIAYLNTILMSPIQGTVTGVYKNPGDSVRPGEPVFRVENNAIVLIIAKLICRGRVSIGSLLEIHTTLFDQPGSVANVVAEIVAARGQGEDDQWEVIGKVSNLDAAGKSIFPLGYHFDYENTTIFIDEPNEI
jgi:hypothetical protein